MIVDCRECDPSQAIIYGYCPRCFRRCEKPMIDPKDPNFVELHTHIEKHWVTEDYLSTDP